MQKIVPHLWYDKEAKEAAEFYVSVFNDKDSALTNVTTLSGTPAGDSHIVSFTLYGQEFQAISAGPHFKFNPSISFMVRFAAKEVLTEAWNKLSDGGKELMPLASYPFSDWYGWIQDKYGLSWQLMLAGPEDDARPALMPSLLFTGPQYGKAEEAVQFYLSVFKNGKKGHLARYPRGMEPDQEGTVMFADFCLENLWLTVMDSAYEQKFNFNEAVSFIVHCDGQEEIDYYWEKLSAVPEAEQCGWLKDMFGLSWQIVPIVLDEMMKHGTQEQLERLTKAFLLMKKFDLAALEKAYEGKEKIVT